MTGKELTVPLPEKTLWATFTLYVLLTFCGLAGMFSGESFRLVIIYTPFILLLSHAIWTLSVRRGLAFIVLAGLIGFVAEFLGLRYGTVFGGRYTYPQSASLFGVPLSVIAYWAIFIYAGYWLVTTFLFWLGKDKPCRGQDSLWRLGLLVIADGLAVTAIDLFMDPIQVKAGAWRWVHAGSYFGVPIGNFVGWFCVTVIVTGIFRLFEYYWPQKQNARAKAIYTLPVLGYLLIGINFLLGAFKYNLSSLAIVGAIIVILPAAFNLGLWIRLVRSQGTT